MSQATVRSSFCMCFLSDSGVFVLPVGGASRSLLEGSEVTVSTFTVDFGRRFGTKLGGVFRRFGSVFVLPVGGPSRSLLVVRGAPWVARPQAEP